MHRRAKTLWIVLPEKVLTREEVALIQEETLAPIPGQLKALTSTLSPRGDHPLVLTR